MEFGVKERIVLGASLDGLRGDIARLRILRELRESFSFSEEDIKRFALQLPTEDYAGYRWSAEKEELKEIEIGDEARKIIVERLKELNGKGQLADEHLDVIDRFPEVEDD